MRYRGQGHEITISLPAGDLTMDSRAELTKLFEASYAATFGRTIPGLAVEIMTWTLRLAAEQPALPKIAAANGEIAAKASGNRPVYDQAEQDMRPVDIYHRRDLQPGSLMQGPAIVAEDETTTIVPKGFVARLNGIGAIVLEKVEP